MACPSCGCSIIATLSVGDDFHAPHIDRADSAPCSLLQRLETSPRVLHWPTIRSLRSSSKVLVCCNCPPACPSSLRLLRRRDRSHWFNRTQRAPLSADAAALVAGNNQFAWNIYQHLSSDAKPTENVLVSPFSISAALAMTYAGARGQTAQQMAAVLGFTLPDDRLHPAFGELLRDLTAPRDGYQLDIANRLFGQYGYDFKKPFLDITGSDYSAAGTSQFRSRRNSQTYQPVGRRKHQPQDPRSATAGIDRRVDTTCTNKRNVFQRLLEIPVRKDCNDKSTVLRR